MTYDVTNAKEVRLRAPLHYLSGIRTPTFVIGGAKSDFMSLVELNNSTNNPLVQFLLVEGADHFNVLRPCNDLIARKIAVLEGAESLEIQLEELVAAVADRQQAELEADDLATLAKARRTGLDITERHLIGFRLLARNKNRWTKAATAARKLGFGVEEIRAPEGWGGLTHYLLVATKRLHLDKLSALFSASRTMTKIAAEHHCQYDGWDPE